VPQLACSRLKETSRLSVAPKTFTGMVTIPKLIDPRPGYPRIFNINC